MNILTFEYNGNEEISIELFNSENAEENIIESGEEEDEEPDFQIDEDDEGIQIAKSVGYKLLKHPRIRPYQIIAIGEALLAIERLPMSTPGVNCKFGIRYEAGTPEYNERIYIDFIIRSDLFEISKGGVVYDKSVGSDSYSDDIWIIEAGCRPQRYLNIYNLENSINEYLTLGAEISVSNESEIDYDQLS